jgi:hypothetical protein
MVEIPARRAFSKVDFDISLTSTRARFGAQEGKPHPLSFLASILRLKLSLADKGL